MKSIVYLVGAGPGDPGLLTLRGKECLERAQVVVYDHLLSNTLLELAPESAERIYVGKSGREHTMEQQDINRLLVQKAGEGKVVVRLKGGDPFVLGRGGEEAEALKEAGIPFEIVPGVTSAVAVPAYAGIPVTHRGLASSFAVVTGHEDGAKTGSTLNWAKLATGPDTLVFLMGVRNLPMIAGELIRHGRPPETPVAVIKNGAGPGQQVVTGRLTDIAEKVKKAGLTAPAVTVVGEVVSLRDRLAWYDVRPLFGKRVLVTRSRRQASVLSRLLTERGAEPVELPAIDIQPVADNAELDKAALSMSGYDWLVFTSANGVEAFLGRLRALGRDSRALAGLKVGAIGPATASALDSAGIVPDFVPPVYTGHGLVEGFAGRDVRGKSFLLLRADIADKELSEGLLGLGAKVHEVAAYRTVALPNSEARERLLAGTIDVVTFTSSSTVAGLKAALNGASFPPKVKVACIGPKTAEAAAHAGLRVDILAAEQTIPGLVDAIENYFAKEAG